MKMAENNIENNFLKLFEAAKWGDTIDNPALATVHRTLVGLPSCNQDEDFTQCAYSMLYEAVRFAEEHQVPILLDY